MVLLGQAGYLAADIRRQVKTLCHSTAFEGKKIQKELLEYLVEKALAGKVPRAVDIATELFGKEDLYPGDSHVRGAAGLLRKCLAKHYASSEVQPGEIRLELPDQQYFILAPRAPAAVQEAAPLVRSDSRIAASILEPADGAEVYQRLTVKGSIEALHPDLRAWLVVGTPVGDHYPQCRVSRSSPQFEHEVRIGRLQQGSDEGAEYVIHLVAADADGDSAFYNYLKSGRDGFGPMLPSDAIVLDSKRVTRRDIRPEMQSPQT